MVCWDPLRKREVTATPEEKVRQWFIYELENTFKVPRHMMMSEAGFSFGGKKYRADIVVYDRSCRPTVVVECKRPEVELDGKVVRQAMRYNSVLDVRFIILTSGVKTLVYQRVGDSFLNVPSVPEYESMICLQ